jgi:hypothetical protein
VLGDPAYGNDSNFRAGITELGLPYVLGIMGSDLLSVQAGSSCTESKSDPVYDYADSAVPVLARMTAKRGAGYRALGYVVT